MTIEPVYRDQASLECTNLLTSEGRRWSSLGVCLFRTVADGGVFETAPTKEIAVGVALQEELGREIFVSGRWKRPEVRPGTIATTCPGETWRQRYNNRKEKNVNTMLQLRIPQLAYETVAEHFFTREQSTYTAVIDDVAITHFGLSVMRALQAGASDLYAQASAQWLSTQMILGSEKARLWRAALCHERIPDQRLTSILEYINEHLKDDLSLQALARQSGLSQFQITSLFRGAMGKSTHKHVLHLRMQNAAYLLRETKRTVLEIAMLCGFKTTSHFGVAFQKHFSQSPTEYRFAEKVSKFARVSSGPRVDFGQDWDSISTRRLVRQTNTRPDAR